MAFSVSSADLTALYTGVDLQIRDAYDRYTPQLRGLAMEINSVNEQEAHVLQAINSVYTRWNGNRESVNLVQKTRYTVNGKAWQKKISIPRRDVELKSRTLDMGAAAAKVGKGAKAKPDEILVSLLQGGASAACIDGANFFSATHPVVPWDSSYGTFTNLRTVFPLTRANYRTALQAMMSLRGWDLQPFEVDKFYLVVPPQLRSQGKDIVESAFAPLDGTQTGTSVAGNNVDKDSATLIVSQKLGTESDVWYIISVEQAPSNVPNDAPWGKGGPLSGPFVIQKWRDLEIIPRFALDGENVFERDEFEIGASLGMEGDYLLPHHAVRCQGS